jgi:hypothetical protein
MMKQAGTAALRAPWGSRRAQLACAAALVLASSERLAGAQQAPEGNPSKASCAEAYESAQESRASGHLQETRERLAYCAQPECPGFVQKDCARWLDEVERELPSIIVSATASDGQPLQGASVSLDGQVVADALTSKSISVDPGRHELVVQDPQGTKVTRTIIAQQGVQNRPVEVRFGAAPASVTSAPIREEDPRDSTLMPYAYAAWGAGAVGFGVFAVLGTLGRADERGLEEDCPMVMPVAPAEGLDRGVCLTSRFEERRDSYKREFVFADVGLVTGIVGAAAGTLLFVLSQGASPEDTSAPAAGGLSIEVGPTQGGAWANLQGRF